MKRLEIVLVLLLAGFAAVDDDPIVIMSPEAFIRVSAETPKRAMCFSCVGTDGELLDRCLIKGNINKKKRIYHCPNWRDYDKTIIELEKGERYFYTVAEAERAGWVEPKYPKDPWCTVGHPVR